VSALWLLLVPVVLVGGFFLGRSFLRVSKALAELRNVLSELADAGAALNAVQQEVPRPGESLDETHRR
jgi:hypothetical protein